MADSKQQLGDVVEIALDAEDLQLIQQYGQLDETIEKDLAHCEHSSTHTFRWSREQLVYVGFGVDTAATHSEDSELRLALGTTFAKIKPHIEHIGKDMEIDEDEEY